MDREKVIKGLECLARKHEQTANPCSKCDYHDRPNFAFCVVDVATDALALLKEQLEIVRCKDCTFGRPAKDESGSDAVRCFSDVHPLDWFCADCVRKTS